MKPSTIFSILFCLLCFNQGFAQRQNVYFLKNSGVQVNLRDSADFIRVVSEPDSGTTLYNVKEYYKTGKIRLIGKTSKIEPLQLEGQCVTYFPSGKKRIYANYKDGRLEGDVFSYFPNGKPYAYKRYSQTPVTQGSGFREDYAIMACNDSVGKELVVNGNGYYIGYDSDFKNVVEEGNVKSGLRDGKWKGSNGNEKNYITFAEEYDNGKMISGQSVDKDGLVVNYTTRAYEPQFKNGIQAFYQFLASSMI
jgi:antitoxin component YwqK of YwqJK toxin-antitoxin module